MPLYEYECEACGERFELIRRYSDPDVHVCARCGKGPVRRLFSSPAIQFKGSGWYITDYARKTTSDKKAGEKGADGTSEAASGADKASGAEKKGDGAAKSDAAKSDAPAKPAGS